MADTMIPSEARPAEARPARRKTSFAGDVLRLVSGTTVAQLMGILASPILTRLYAPEAFGLAAVFTSIVSILGVIACLRFELSIMLPDTDEEAANLLGVSLMFAVLISLLTVPIVWWGGDALAGWLNAPNLTPYLWLVPLAVLFTGILTALNYWNSRTKRFGRLSIARVAASVTTITTQLGAGLAGFASGGTLIGASIGGNVLATTVLGGQIWQGDRKVLLGSIRWREMAQGICRHRKFPLYDIWAALLNTISWQLPPFLLSAFFSSIVVGYYALGFRVLQLPMSLIGQSIGQVFFQRASEANSQGKLAPLVEAVFRRLVMVGIFPMLMLAIIGHDLYAVVFGADWAEAGVYVQILALWAFFWFISSPLSTLISVLEKQEQNLKLNVVILLTRLGSLVVGGYFGNARLSLALFTMTGTLVYGYLGFWVMTESGVPLSRAFGVLGRAILSSAPFGFIVLLLRVVVSKTWIILFAIFALFGLYMAVLKRRHPDLFCMIV